LGIRHRTFVALGLAILACAPAVWSQEGAPNTSREPEVTSLFPLGGLRGALVEVDVRGKSLKGAYAVWLSAADVTARISKVDEVPADKEQEKKGTPVDRAMLQIEVQKAAEPGTRMLRFVTPNGVSNAVAFNVVSDATIAESTVSHGLPERAQAVTPPVVIDGAIGPDSESDYYSFEVSPDQELAMEILRASPPANVLNATGKGDVALTLYAAASSWFDAHRPQRLAVSFEPTALGSPAEPQIRYRFTKGGRYLIEVAGNRAAYQLRIGPATGAKMPGKESGWTERSFARVLDAGRIESLWTRTVRAPAAETRVIESGTAAETVAVAERPPSATEPAAFSSHPLVIEETQPNDSPAQAKPAPIPSLIEGAIEHPGDRDYFKFTVKSGERLAFEMETPKTTPPRFNPILTVLDGDGKVVLTSVYRRIGRNDTFYVKTPEPKVAYTFEREGEYTLEIRDATSRWGDPGFRYRILLRPQVPHLGDIQVDADRLNIARGEAKKLNVTTAQEEEFSGDIAVAVEGLPDGVDIVPATEVKPEKGPPLDEGHKTWFRPKAETASILLMARADAPLTGMPKFVRVVCRPVVRGVVGAPVLVKELPLMVVKKESQ
jgi:hypothetical protein